MPLVALQCPSCGANLKVDSGKDAAICEHCGRPYIVKDAIVNQYLIIDQASVHIDTVNLSSQKDFEISGGRLIRYSGESDSVAIPDSVTEIGDGAFRSLPIKEVSIPSTVFAIGRNAFWGCERIERIVIPESVTCIKSGAFANCKHLKKIVLLKKAEVQKNAFANCDELCNLEGTENDFNKECSVNGRCRRCGLPLVKAGLLDRLDGFKLLCEPCGLVYKK